MAESNADSRLEAFSDGVFAIALTLLIIDVKLPSTESITNSAELWRAVWHLAPALFAFVLSFAVILITWVNHRAVLRLVNGTTTSLLYANGALLLTVVCLPFATSLLGEFLWTDHAAPAVVIYDALLAATAVGWILICGAALRGGLTKNDAARATMIENGRSGYYGVVLYAGLSILAYWFPRTIAAVTALSWAIWLVRSLRMKTA